MFVSTGAREQLLNERRDAFAERYLTPLIAEARALGLTADDLADLIRRREIADTTAAGDTTTHTTEGRS